MVIASRAGGSLVLASAALVLLSATFRADRAFVNTPTSTIGRFLRGAPTSRGSDPQGNSAPQAGASLLAVCSLGSLFLATAAGAARRGAASVRHAEGAGKEITTPSIPRPENLLESPKFPLWMGSTGGYMSKATRERHAITWTSKGAYGFEMPTGGLAIMNQGENLCYFRKKEQCIALGKQLRKLKIENYKIYRLKKDGTVIFMHPADGVFPEKVNKGRVQVNGRPFTVAQNPQPATLKWTKYNKRSYEADPLTTMFVKARIQAFSDQENLFPIPQPNQWVAKEDWPEYSEKYQQMLKSL